MKLTIIGNQMQKSEYPDLSHVEFTEKLNSNMVRIFYDSKWHTNETFEINKNNIKEIRVEL